MLSFPSRSLGKEVEPELGKEVKIKLFLFVEKLDFNFQFVYFVLNKSNNGFSVK